MPFHENPKPSTKWFHATIACGEVDPSEQADPDGEPTVFDAQGEELEELLDILEAEIQHVFWSHFGPNVQVRLSLKSHS